MKYVFFLFIAALTACTPKFHVPQSCDSKQSCIYYVKRKIQSHFWIQEEFEGQVVKLEIRLNEKAEIISSVVRLSSGSQELEKAAEKAVNKASPFSALRVLSPEVYEEFKFIKLTFEPHVE